jgi:redox-sensitive bicupin YhaK (pirin superfamily)
VIGGTGATDGVTIDGNVGAGIAMTLLDTATGNLYVEQATIINTTDDATSTIYNGQGIDVRPHPHIGLATVTYLHSGRIHHRDSLGTDSWIAGGDVNLMIAGQGITHSERMDDKVSNVAVTVFGLQTWLALPKAQEDRPAAFLHAAQGQLPLLEGEGKTVRIILGRAYGEEAPVETPSEMFYLDARLDPFASLPLPDDHEDRGVYVLQGDVTVAGQDFAAGRMLVFRPGDRVSLKAGPQGARLRRRVVRLVRVVGLKRGKNSRGTTKHLGTYFLKNMG